MKKYKDLLFTGDTFLVLFIVFILITTLYEHLTIKNLLTLLLSIIITILFLISGIGIAIKDFKK
jgi:hypothetical protein